VKRYYDSDKKRLLYFGEEANPEMWEKTWEKQDLEKIFSRVLYSMEDKSILGTTRKYLPAGARILEGGCGLGDIVFILNQSGYEVIGVDYARASIEKVREFMPELDIRYGDLRELAFPDCFFDGYWSLGVIEHFYDGYDRIAREMFRILKKGGYLFMTVPAMSRLREIKAAVGIYPRFDGNEVDISRFYQFAYSSEEIRRNFCEFGFQFVERQGWAVYKGVRDEIPGTHFLMSFLCRFFAKLTWHLLIPYCNHMDLFVFRK